jgi:hypothetical protein
MLLIYLTNTDLCAVACLLLGAAGIFAVKALTSNQK